MKLLIKLAWRNLWRNKRRTIITICAVVFASMLAIAMRGIQLGTYEANIKHAVSLFSGYLQVQKDGYLDNPSLQKSFRFDGNLQTILASEQQVTGFTGFHRSWKHDSQNRNRNVAVSEKYGNHH